MAHVVQTTPVCSSARPLCLRLISQVTQPLDTCCRLFPVVRHVRQPMQGSSLTNLQAFSRIFSLGQRCQKNVELHHLIREHGVHQTVMGFTQKVKPLQMAHDVLSTFLDGAHTEDKYGADLRDIEKGLKGRKRGEDEDNEARDEDKLAEIEMQLQQIHFATTTATLMTRQDCQEAVRAYRYNGNASTTSNGTTGLNGDVYDWVDAAFHRVFKDVLSGVKSTSLTKSTGRMQQKDIRMGNKNAYSLGVGNVPHVSAWAHPYLFDALTIYEFVSSLMIRISSIPIKCPHNIQST